MSSSYARLAALVAVAVVVVRVVRLDSMPGEWYGDISTLYEYTQALRLGSHPPGWYVVGVGPAYPMLMRPFLWVLGDSYLAIKISAVVYSLVGLLLLYRFGKQLVDRQLAVVAVAVGGFMSWWLVYSRLGDLQAATPTITVATLSATVAGVRAPTRPGLAVLAGSLAVSGIYVYGNLFVLPVIVAIVLAVAWRSGRISAPTVGYASAAGAFVALPMLVEFAREPDAVLHGHVGQRLVSAGDLLPALVRGYGEALWAYMGVGDPGFRGNVASEPHIDRVTLITALVGIGWWLRGERRRQGVFLLGSFLLLHLPSVLAGPGEVPSVSRTTAAAPLVALFAAAGIFVCGRAVAHWGQHAAAAVVTLTVAAIAVLGVHQYFWRYIPGLPYGNTPIASSMTDYVDSLPADVTVYLAGTGWLDQMPEVKSVQYAAVHGERVVEERLDTLDCHRLGMLQQPAVLLWDFTRELPTEALRDCANGLGAPTLHTAANGRPAFRSAAVPAP